MSAVVIGKSSGKNVSLDTVPVPLPPQESPRLEQIRFDPSYESSVTGITGPEQRILNAIAWMESIGVAEPKQTAVAFLAGYTYGGGGFNNSRGALRTGGYLEYRGDRLALTEGGRQLAKAPITPLTTEELHRHVLHVLPGPEQKILSVLLEAYPGRMSKDEVARKSGYEPGGTGFSNPCGRLRSMGLVGYPSKGEVVAEDILFVE